MLATLLLAANFTLLMTSYFKMADEAEATGSNDRMFGPLTLEDSKYTLFLNGTQTQCILCEDSFNLLFSVEIFMKHLFDAHNLIIEDYQNIENLPEYINYWREKCKVVPFEQIVPTVNVEVIGEKYYLLSTLQEEDKKLRYKLRLEHVLKVQEFERVNKNYVRQCLFCKLKYEGTRHGFLSHLSTQHNIWLGNPQNLVYIEELIEKVDRKLLDLNCLYCKKSFSERKVLKEHMRKKLHKRINPYNKEYDKYYIVNYLEVDKNWQDIEKEEDKYALPPNSSDVNSDEEYSDWNEKDTPITCLFCENSETDINNLCLHMDGDHKFDFVEETKNLDFYQKIKLVNYIRRQTHREKCLYCDEQFENSAKLWIHLHDQRHCRIPEVKAFDQPEYYFPTYENDAFLYFIDDVED